MGWIKNAIVDFAVTIAILILAFSKLNALYWVLVIYTGFMLLVKIVGLLGPAVKTKTGLDTPPDWVYHVLYAVNVGLLLYASFWYLAGGWAAIWVLSIIYQRRRG